VNPRLRRIKQLAAKRNDLSVEEVREVMTLFTDFARDFLVRAGSLQRLAREGERMVFQHQGPWACVDTYRDRQHLNHLRASNQAFCKVWA
jgi:hypothetical protein